MKDLFGTAIVINRSRWIVTIAAVAFGWLFSSTTFGVIEYALTNLGPGYADGINDSDEVVGALGYETALQAFTYTYTNGVTTVYGQSLTGTGSTATAINQAGEATGAFNIHPTVPSTGYTRQSNGTVTNLPLYNAFAINDAGIVAGVYNNNGNGNAAIYSGNTVTDFGTLGGNYSEADGINDSGLVVGRSRDSSGNDHAVYWQTGNTNTFILSSKPYSAALGVNSSGQIVGHNLFYPNGGDSVYHATLWQNGTSTDLSPNAAGSSIAYAINNIGTIVGVDGFAVIWQNGVEQNLNNLIAPNSGITLYAAYGINDSGQIVGYGATPNLEDYAFLLTPIPEPSAASLLIMICAAIAMVRRKPLHHRYLG